MPSRIPTTPFLRFALLLDAAASGAIGLLLAPASKALSPLFGLPAALLAGTGLFCLAYAALLAWLSSRPRQATALIWLVIVGNGVWAVQSVVLLATGWLQPTTLGLSFVIAQAAAVAIFAELQFMALRKAGRADAVAA